MERLTENKIVLIVRRTRLDDLMARFNTESQARFYIEHLGADFTDYAREHERYHRVLAEVRSQLGQLGLVQTLERPYLPHFAYGPEDVVVVLGQDGLVANVIKYLDGQPVVGVNPDPGRWEGLLLPFSAGDLPRVIPEVFAGRRPLREVTMAQVTLSNHQVLYGVNDLFIGPRSHTSARYVIEVGGRREQQSSSGIIVSTGLGSTGWLRSILAGASGIQAYYSPGTRLQVKDRGSFAWDAPYLYYTVREPWPSKTSAASLCFGRITPQQPLRLVSQMPENGVIFSDGIERDYLEFNSGMHATVTIAPKKGYLVG